MTMTVPKQQFRGSRDERHTRFCLVFFASLLCLQDGATAWSPSASPWRPVSSSATVLQMKVGAPSETSPNHKKSSTSNKKKRSSSSKKSAFVPESSSKKGTAHTSPPSRKNSSPPKRANNNNNRQQQRVVVASKTQNIMNKIPINNTENINNKPKTLGEAVQQASTVTELLDVASQFWLPSDPDLPGHLRVQEIHHEKRQRWSSQWLSKLGQACLHHHDGGQDVLLSTLWQDERLGRAVLAAAVPFIPNQQQQSCDDGCDDDHQSPTPRSQAQHHTIAAATTTTNDKERRSLKEALLGLHTLAGHTTTPSSATMSTTKLSIHSDILSGVQLLLSRAEAMAPDFSVSDAIEACWAVQGISTRLNSLLRRGDDAEKVEENLALLPMEFEQLENRVKGLPFTITPMGINWLEGVASEAADNTHGKSGEHWESYRDLMTNLQESIPFHFDTIVTRHGAEVMERRGTAWVCEEGIGALAYSGKLMPPSPMPPLVRSVMRRVEQAIQLDNPTSGDFFDCALCNYYPDGESACKFHTDPEHGTMWERLNCVVAIGDPRRFAFRPIPDISTWEEWDKNERSYSESRIEASNNNNKESSLSNLPVVIRVFPGDIVQMWGTCNDDFHHAVYPENELSADGNIATKGGLDLSRISLVLKRAMPHGSKQRRGHGMAGEGRRARHRSKA